MVLQFLTLNFHCHPYFRFKSISSWIKMLAILHDLPPNWISWASPIFLNRLTIAFPMIASFDPFLKILPSGNPMFLLKLIPSLLNPRIATFDGLLFFVNLLVQLFHLTPEVQEYLQYQEPDLLLTPALEWWNLNFTYRTSSGNYNIILFSVETTVSFKQLSSIKTLAKTNATKANLW